MLNKDLILASASPRRRELIKNISRDVACVTADVDEEELKRKFLDKSEEAPDIKAYVAALAEAKSLYVSAENKECLVIGADTVVRSPDNQILGKPHDASEALAYLKMLCGRTHSVFTAVCISRNGKILDEFIQETEVEFYGENELPEGFLEDYITNDKPLDKAGAYGIQDRGALLCKAIKGDYYNVMGLPIAKLNIILNKI